MNDLTYLVSTPPQNIDVLEFHSILLRKYWADCPYETVAVINDNTIQYDTIRYNTIIFSGRQKNTIGRLRYALEKIKTPYVLLSYEDFFIYSPVHTARIKELFSVMKEYGAMFFSLTSAFLNDYPYIDTARRIKEIPENTAYRYNFQLGIWQKDFLLSLLADYDNIWDFERQASFSSKGKNTRVLQADYSGYPYIECVRRGKWLPEGISLLVNEGLYPNLKIRGILSEFNMLQQSLKGFIFNLNREAITRFMNLFNCGYKAR
ncbi:hypothetical protein [Treponema putidum]|uniref:hypothetical protein n=1 Tax=Treponema putidum TaxID=221027 RepID=UPI003D8A21CB